MGNQTAYEKTHGTRDDKIFSKLLVIQALSFSFVVIAVVFFSAPVSAGVNQNLYYDLATDPLSDWTEAGFGQRSGVLFQSSGNPITYRRSVAIDSVAFQIEAILSAEALAIDAERGARLWAQFYDTVLPPLSRYRIELRLSRAGGVNRLELADGNTSAVRAYLEMDWAAIAPRLRVRLKRQQVEGADYVLLQAEPSSGWDNPGQPNNLSGVGSVGVLLSTFTAAAGSTEVGFGNVLPGVYYSDWESIHITTADDLATEFPYWPPAPAAPGLVHEDSGLGNAQRIALSSFLSGYLPNDSVTPELAANGTTYTGETRQNPGNSLWNFDGINCTQTVYGRLTVSDVSGRSSQSPLSSVPVSCGRIGSLSSGKWCTSDGSLINCTVDPPLLTESDPGIGINSINYVPKWNGSQFVSGIITDDGSTVNVNGALSVASIFTLSDGRFKKEILPLRSPMDKIMHLQGVSYALKRDEYLGRGFKTGRQIGLIAQEVENVLPELVLTDEKGYKAVAYDKLAPVLIEAVKELKEIIDRQQAEIEYLKKTVKELTGRAK